MGEQETLRIGTEQLLITNRYKSGRIIDFLLLMAEGCNELRIVTDELELTSLLLLETVWGDDLTIRIVVGNGHRHRLLQQVIDMLKKPTKNAIETLKAQTDDLSFLEIMLDAIKNKKLEVRSFLKDKLNLSYDGIKASLGCRRHHGRSIVVQCEIEE